MSATREQVVAAVAGKFPGAEEFVMELLDLYGTQACERERERVQLAIVALSGGDGDKLLDLVQDAKRDYRDVLCLHDNGPIDPVKGEELQRRARELIEKWGRKP